jgi:ketosteroid isomerase-like protein
MASVSDTEQAVLRTNAAFYAAFESRDLDAMAELWERSDRVAVTHPGWPTLHGWPRVLGSWDAIFAGTVFMQFLISDERCSVVGDTAWVTCDENILQSGPSREGGEDLAEIQGARVAALNLFVFDAQRWRMVAHYGASVGFDLEE